MLVKKVPKLRDMLQKELKLSEKEIERFPAKYKVLGKLAVIRLPEKFSHMKKRIGEIILENDPRVKSVLNVVEGIKGVYREPQVEVIAGNTNTETMVVENECKFKLDAKKLMFCLGNQHERLRMSKIVFSDEIVIDMFAGIGQFSIPIAVHCKPQKIFSIELNPLAYKYLLENIFLNNVENIIYPILGDSKEIVPNLLKQRADRVIMGYVEKTQEFLDAAMAGIKVRGGVIHYHNIYKISEIFHKPIAEINRAAIKSKRKVERVIHKRIVKSYGPKLVHIVIDVKIK